MQDLRIEQSFSVPYTYALYFTQGLFSTENALLSQIIRDYKPSGKVKILFIIDQGVHDHHPQLTGDIEEYCQAHSQFLRHTETIIMPGGEYSKNDPSCTERVIEAIDKNKICRHSFVMVIGGGAIIDMVGYAAAIAHRGVKLIRIPTTVLSQNDAAVGVKNSINYFGKKNFLGTFAPPFAIINDQEFLTTLDQRDWISGAAEGVKVALIKDIEFFIFIEKHARELRHRNMKSMHALIYRCAEMHMEHIARGGDPFESGSSRPLDFGHWAAHKLEHMTGYALRHGEAVAKGMALDMMYAHLSGMTSEAVLDRVLRVLEEIGFDLSIPISTDEEMDQLLAGIQEFREHLGGELTITMVSEIGKKQDVHKIDHEKMKQAVKALVQRPKSSLE